MNKKDSLVIIKNGNFYNSYNDDAFIMNYLFGYKINKDNKCGFPESVFNKVINTLEDKKISYEVIFKDKNSLVKKYNRLNNYNKFLKKSISFQDIKVRIDRISNLIDKIDNIDVLDKLLSIIEDELQ